MSVRVFSCLHGLIHLVVFHVWSQYKPLCCSLMLINMILHSQDHVYNFAGSSVVCKQARSQLELISYHSLLICLSTLKDILKTHYGDQRLSDLCAESLLTLLNLLLNTPGLNITHHSLHTLTTTSLFFPFSH